jgi:hypothetical protein
VQMHNIQVSGAAEHTCLDNSRCKSSLGRQVMAFLLLDHHMLEFYQNRPRLQDGTTKN